MLIRIVRMSFKPEKKANFLALFDSVKEKIRRFEGCLHLSLLSDCDHPQVLITYSQWLNEEALENYRHSELFTRTWEKTKVLFAARPVAHSLKPEEEVSLS